MADLKNTILWTCDETKFKKIISVKDTYYETLGYMSNFTWVLEIKVERIPRQYEISVESVKFHENMKETEVAKIIKYYNFLWQFSLVRDSDYLITNVTAQLISGTDVIAEDLTFYKGSESALIGNFDTTRLVGFKLDLLLAFERSYEIDTIEGKRIYVEEIFTQKAKISNLKNLSTDMWTLFREELFADVVIKCGSEIIKAHKSILGTRSPVFKAELEKREVIENTNIELEVYDIDTPVFRALLTFIYCGKVNVFSEDMASKLILAANKYQIKGLKDQICNYYKHMDTEMQSMNPGEREIDDTIDAQMQPDKSSNLELAKINDAEIQTSRSNMKGPADIELGLQTSEAAMKELADIVDDVCKPDKLKPTTQMAGTNDPAHIVDAKVQAIEFDMQVLANIVDGVQKPCKPDIPSDTEIVDTQMQTSIYGMQELADIVDDIQKTT